MGISYLGKSFSLHRSIGGYLSGRFKQFGSKDDNGIFPLQKKLGNTMDGVKDDSMAFNGLSDKMIEDASS